jgi:hypothetical protein
VYAVIADDRVDSRMKLNSAYLKAGKLSLCPNVVDVIIRYPAERSSHASAYSGLFAVGYRVVPYNVRADFIFGPAIL